MLHETISATISAVVMGLAGWGVNLEGRMRVLETRQEDLQKHLDQRFDDLKEHLGQRLERIEASLNGKHEEQE